MVIVYVAMVLDRHKDPAPEVFTVPEAAIEYAKRYAQEHFDPEYMDESETPEGWLYHASSGIEDDCVWVESKVLDGKVT